jgi:hypothetical protein
VGPSVASALLADRASLLAKLENESGACMRLVKDRTFEQKSKDDGTDLVANGLPENIEKAELVVQRLVEEVRSGAANMQVCYVCVCVHIYMYISIYIYLYMHI